MSKVEVDQIDPQSGTTLTLGTSGDTVSIPAGVTISNSGTASGFASIDWQSSVKTGNFSASANEGYWVDTTSTAITATLPGSASVGDTIEFVDFARKFQTNNLTINQNSLNFQGNTTPNPVYSTNGQSVRIVYSGSTKGWIPTTDDDVTFKTAPSYSVDFLVVAGGGGGGTTNSGGGGGGGMRTSTQTSAGANTITVTIGAGGAGGIGGGGGRGNGYYWDGSNNWWVDSHHAGQGSGLAGSAGSNGNSRAGGRGGDGGTGGNGGNHGSNGSTGNTGQTGSNGGGAGANCGGYPGGQSGKAGSGGGSGGSAGTKYTTSHSGSISLI